VTTWPRRAASVSTEIRFADALDKRDGLWGRHRARSSRLGPARITSPIGVFDHTSIRALAVKGHQELPSGGHEFCPLMAT